MAITKSAKKAARQTISRTKVNDGYRLSMKFAVKELRDGMKKGGEDLTDKMIKAQKRIDKAIKARVITKKSGARKKSSLAKTLNSIGK